MVMYNLNNNEIYHSVRAVFCISAFIENPISLLLFCVLIRLALRLAPAALEIDIHTDHNVRNLDED